MYRVLLFLADVKVDPNVTGLPGGTALQHMINGLAGFGLLACAAAVIIGGAAWGLGHQSGNFQYSAGGKRGVLGGIAGAFVIGASAAIVNFFFNAGHGI
ncbi:MAG: hypothetical protein QOJ33_1710 [Chloroflexota bacterium]|jgi:hypothetical protein|nr:hypothetical protein [Chloroflexota bacterium]